MALAEDPHAESEFRAAELAPSSAGAVAASLGPVSEPVHRFTLSHSEIKKIYFGLMLAQFLGALNQTVVATALPAIGRDFADVENLSWVVTAYLLSSTAVAPLYGKLADIFGRRFVLLTAIGLFTVGSLVCAASPSMMTLILARFLQGIGGGGIIPLVQTIIADVVSARERGRYQAYMAVVWVSSGVGGPVLGGFISQHASWPWIFWLNVPLGLAALMIAGRTLRLAPQTRHPHKLDYLGCALMMLASIALLMGLTWGGARYPWFSQPILILFGVAAVSAAAFGWHVIRATEPFLPPTILRNKIARRASTATSCAMATTIGMTIFTPLYFQLVHGFSPSDAGLALIPLMLMNVPGALLAGRVMMYFRNYKWLPVIGSMLSFLALLIPVIHPQISPGAVIVILGVVGIGAGTVFPVATVSLQNAVPRFQIGTATGAMNFIRALTSAFAVAVMSAIMLAGLGAAPGRVVDISVLAAAAEANGAIMSEVFRWVFLAAAVLIAINMAAIALMEEKPLPGRSGLPQG
jgi:EmrB/QacA subfamily drug resistance transporter